MKRVAALSLSSMLTIAACVTNAGNSPPPPPPCDQACQDAIAVRAVRDGLRNVYNKVLIGKDVGPQDQIAPCSLSGGTVHIFGTATSNAAQGATFVQLTYVVDHCKVTNVDTDPLRNYSLTISGTVTESGTLAQQPTSNMALDIASTSLDIVGTVHDPAIDYSTTGCALVLSQNGNQIAGTLCGRTAGLTL